MYDTKIWMFGVKKHSLHVTITYYLKLKIIKLIYKTRMHHVHIYIHMIWCGFIIFWFRYQQYNICRPRVVTTGKYLL